MLVYQRVRHSLVWEEMLIFHMTSSDFVGKSIQMDYTGTGIPPRSKVSILHGEGDDTPMGLGYPNTDPTETFREIKALVVQQRWV